MTVPALEVKLIESRRERAAVRSHQANASQGGMPEPLKGTALLQPHCLSGAGSGRTTASRGDPGSMCLELLQRVALSVAAWARPCHPAPGRAAAAQSKMFWGSAEKPLLCNRICAWDSWSLHYTDAILRSNWIICCSEIPIRPGGGGALGFFL